MRAAVLHVNTAKRDSIGPTIRIARFVADTLGIPLLHNADTASAVRKPVDVLFVKHGMLKFSSHRDEAMRIYAQARTVINLENDFTFKRDKRMAREDETNWSTVEGRDQYVNWNKLTWSNDWSLDACPLQQAKTPGLFYWGAYKDIRLSSFRRYMLGARYPIIVSTYRGRKPFQELNPNIAVIGALRGHGLGQFQSTVYIEDDYSHRLYCSPANRFYEAVQAGLPIAIDSAAAPTLTRAGVVDVQGYVVTGTADMKQFMRHQQQLRHEQRNLWFKDYYKSVTGELIKVCRSVFGSKFTFNKGA
jgi:hypothetical protein